MALMHNKQLNIVICVAHHLQVQSRSIFASAINCITLFTQ